MVAKVNNYLLVWLPRIWWGRLWPKNGWVTPPGGSSKLKNTSIGYKWLQKLIITCWYGYCGYGEVGCDPKMGGGPPGGIFPTPLRTDWTSVVWPRHTFVFLTVIYCKFNSDKWPFRREAVIALWFLPDVEPFLTDAAWWVSWWYVIPTTRKFNEGTLLNK